MNRMSTKDYSPSPQLLKQTDSITFDQQMYTQEQVNNLLQRKETEQKELLAKLFLQCKIKLQEADQLRQSLEKGKKQLEDQLADSQRQHQGAQAKVIEQETVMKTMFFKFKQEVQRLTKEKEDLKKQISATITEERYSKRLEEQEEILKKLYFKFKSEVQRLTLERDQLKSDLNQQTQLMQQKNNSGNGSQVELLQKCQEQELILKNLFTKFKSDLQRINNEKEQLANELKKQIALNQNNNTNDNKMNLVGEHKIMVQKLYVKFKADMQKVEHQLQYFQIIQERDHLKGELGKNSQLQQQLAKKLEDQKLMMKQLHTQFKQEIENTKIEQQKTNQMYTQLEQMVITQNSGLGSCEQHVEIVKNLYQKYKRDLEQHQLEKIALQQQLKKQTNETNQLAQEKLKKYAQEQQVLVKNLYSKFKEDMQKVTAERDQLKTLLNNSGKVSQFNPAHKLNEKCQELELVLQKLYYKYRTDLTAITAERDLLKKQLTDKGISAQDPAIEIKIKEQEQALKNLYYKFRADLHRHQQKIEEQQTLMMKMHQKYRLDIIQISAEREQLKYLLSQSVDAPKKLIRNQSTNDVHHMIYSKVPSASVAKAANLIPESEHKAMLKKIYYKFREDILKITEEKNKMVKEMEKLKKQVTQVNSNSLITERMKEQEQVLKNLFFKFKTEMVQMQSENKSLKAELDQSKQKINEQSLILRKMHQKFKQDIENVIKERDQLKSLQQAQSIRLSGTEVELSSSQNLSDREENLKQEQKLKDEIEELKKELVNVRTVEFNEKLKQHQKEHQLIIHNLYQKFRDDVSKFQKEKEDLQNQLESMKSVQKAQPKNLREASLQTNQDQMITDMHDMIVKWKKNFGEAINIAFDYGGTALVDKLLEASGMND